MFRRTFDHILSLVSFKIVSRQRKGEGKKTKRRVQDSPPAKSALDAESGQTGNPEPSLPVHFISRHQDFHDDYYYFICWHFEVWSKIIQGRERKTKSPRCRPADPAFRVGGSFPVPDLPSEFGTSFRHFDSISSPHRQFQFFTYCVKTFFAP
jgi:hypothetical protein